MWMVIKELAYICVHITGKVIIGTGVSVLFYRSRLGRNRYDGVGKGMPWTRHCNEMCTAQLESVVPLTPTLSNSHRLEIHSLRDVVSYIAEKLRYTINAV